MAIRAVIFDLVGVLLVEAEPDARRGWEERLGLPSGGLDKVLDEAADRYREGMSTDEVHRYLGRTLRLDAEEVGRLLGDLAGDMRLEPALVSFISTIRSAFRVAVLTNNSRPSARAELNEEFNLEEVVDLVVLSGEEGVEKPDPKIFVSTAAQLGVEPAECVLVDDTALHVDAARSVGMTALLHTDAASTIASLEALLGATHPSRG